MKQKLDEEGTKCNVLSKHQKFNERCCMRCCSPFTFLINTKHQCLDCKYNICKNCSTYNKKKKAWICKVCQQAGLLKTQSLEWYYNNVKSRFRRFGSAKVLKNLYKKHLAERGALSDMPEGSICEGSIENEGSICGSDSTFYRQTEGCNSHSSATEPFLEKYPTHPRTGRVSDFGDLCEADMNNGTLQPSVQVDRMEEKLKSRLFELASRISDKESSSSDEQETDLSSKTQELQESPSCEENDGNFHEELKKKYSAISLCNISTEVLKVINATEEFIVEATGPCEPSSSELPERGKLPVYTDAIKLDEQFTKLEENVYTTAGMVYGLEGQLSDLEGCARSISSVTAGAQLAELEDQVATAAAQVHQAELKISDIEKRISALTVAGLNVTPCGRLSRKRDPQQINQVETIDTSRKQRRKLPATPVQGGKAENAPLLALRAFNKNVVLQGSLTQRSPRERKVSVKDLMEPTVGSNEMY
nr:PREDICTED: rab effector MyRIP [Latimeria chalumnae]|eukprot:XP_006008889.2 PREDICTED: rab effector MyRIP [Latimeria chalumnae]